MLCIVKEVLMFDDVFFVFVYFIVLLNIVDFSIQLMKIICLNIFMFFVVMDIVMEVCLVIVLVQEGGIGFIYKNMFIECQVEEVCCVKKYEFGVVIDLQIVLLIMMLCEVKELIECNGFVGYLVVIEENELVGIIIGCDVCFVIDLNQLVSVYMMLKECLVIVCEGEVCEVVLVKMYEKCVEKVLVVDDEFYLIGMIIVKDFQKVECKLNVCKDE